MKYTPLLCVMVLLLLVGCNRDRERSGGRNPTDPPDELQLAGFYRATQTNGVPDCSAPLPPPPLPDENQNEFVRIGPFTIETLVQLQQSGQRIDWIILAIDDQPPSQFPFLGRSLKGNLDQEANVTFQSQLEFREAARQDSLRYHVTWVLDATSRFEESMGTMAVQGTGTSTYTYRTGPGGSVVTTCTVAVSSSGVRDSVPEPPSE